MLETALIFPVLYRYLGEVECFPRTTTSLSYINQSLHFSEKHRLLPEVSETYKILSKIYSQMGFYHKALRLTSTTLRIKIRIPATFRGWRCSMNSKSGEGTGTHRTTKGGIAGGASRKAKGGNHIFVIAFLLAGSLAMIIFFNYREKKRINQILVAQNNEITRQKGEIENQKEEIEKQRDFVTRQRDQIAEQQKLITDSLTYASRIQNAVLPSDQRMLALPWESFVFYKPKNIVSGDFYWVSELPRENRDNGRLHGHGVPGAFMVCLELPYCARLPERHRSCPRRYAGS